MKDRAPWEEESASLQQPSPPLPSTKATIGRMFFLLFPAGIWTGSFFASLLIASYHMDARNMGGACVFVFVTPIAVVCGVIAIVEACRKEGGIPALFFGAIWNMLVIAAIALFIWFKM